MPPLIPAAALTGPAPAVTVLLALGAVVAVVSVVILVRLYRPKRLDEHVRGRRGAPAGGSTVAPDGAGATHSTGGFDGCSDGGGGGGEC